MTKTNQKKNQNTKQPLLEEKPTTLSEKPHFLGWLMQTMMLNCGPGPNLIPMNWGVNLQKGGMSFYIIFLMIYFQNYSDAMLTYLFLHGSYGKAFDLNYNALGIFWLLKDMIFPDPTFQSKATVLSFGIMWAFVLGPYLVPAYKLASR